MQRSNLKKKSKDFDKNCLGLDHEKTHASQKWFDFRYRITLLFIVFMFVVISVRLISFSFIDNDKLIATSFAKKQLSVPREIVDRSNELLATNIVKYSLAVNPKKFKQADSSSTELIKILAKYINDFDIKVEGESLIKKIESRKNFFYIKRGIMEEKALALKKYGIVGLEFIKQNVRFYPQGKLFAHVIGYRDVDNNSLSGIEKGYGELMLDPSKEGVALQTTLDVRLQTILFSKLEKVYNITKAKGAAGVIIDANTSEILALVSYPSFDPHNPSTIGIAAGLNRAALRYEMGSTFKVFNTAMALKEGYGPNFQIDIKDRLRVAEFDITDDYFYANQLSVADIFIHSSNSGSARLALMIGADKQRGFLSSLGLFDPTGIMLPELTSPKYPEIWANSEVATASYGYGIAVTPLHMANAVASLVNGGILNDLKLLKNKEDRIYSAPKKVINKNISNQLTRLLKQVVEKGTGRSARISGYSIGGKTGTTKKFDKISKSYTSGKNLTSFVGVFPINQPKIISYILVDEPKFDYTGIGKITTGGNVASPVFKEIVKDWAANLAIAPNRSSANIQKLVNVNSW